MIGQKGGIARTRLKKRAARENGHKGGRPRNPKKYVCSKPRKKKKVEEFLE